MSYLQTVAPDDLRIIIAIEFEQHARPADVAALKKDLITSSETLHGVETSGSFDLIIEISAPSLPSYHRWLQNFADQMAKVVKRSEPSFIGQRFIRRQEEEKALWVRTSGSWKRIDAHAIDKIMAEGDYVRIHSRDQSWLLHATLRSVFEKLGDNSFVQIHRSLVLRRQFIKEVRREDGRWLVMLEDGTVERVAKSRISDTLEVVREASLEPAD